MNVTALYNKISNQQHLLDRNTAQRKNRFIYILFRHVLDVKHVIVMNCTCGHSARPHRIACEKPWSISKKCTYYAAESLS